MTTDRLTKSDWIRHGLLTLAAEGHGGLKAGPMAAALKVSRGSFYWHFADIADFRGQLLTRWQESMTDQVIRELEAEAAEPDRLKPLMRRAFQSERSLERAMRSWAAEDEAVAAVVASVDDRRIAYIADLLTAAGVAPARALHRTTFLYWAYLGQALVMDRRHTALAPADLDEIGDLFET